MPLFGDVDRVRRRKRRRLNMRRRQSCCGDFGAAVARGWRSDPAASFEENNYGCKRADRYERIGDNAEKMMFAARPAFRMRCQILIEKGQIAQQRKKSGCDCDQQHRFDEGGTAAPITTALSV